MTVVERPRYDATMFAPGPARDARFEVKEQWIDCCNFPGHDPRQEFEFLHRQMNEEVNGMESAARTLVDFPAADWELRMAIARQCCDEARHVEMFRRAFEARGGRVGQFPVLNFQYRIITKIDDLLARLAVQNQSFETGGIDAVQAGIDDASTRGDRDLAELFDSQLADEICHVRFANDHVARGTSRDPALVMRIGRALHYSSQAFLQVMGTQAIESADYPVYEEGRLEAGFTPEHVRMAAVSLMSRSGRTFKLRVRGDSMHPTIPDGAQLKIRAVTPGELRVGQIIVSEVHDDLVAHRVVHCDAGAGTLMTRGDRCLLCDVPIRTDDVRGVAVEFSVGGEWLTPGPAPARGLWKRIGGALDLWLIRLCLLLQFRLAVTVASLRRVLATAVVRRLRQSP